MLVFPTSGGDEREFEGQGMLDTLGHHVEGGKIKLFCVNSVNNQSWYDKGAHPRHRSYVQSVYDAYIVEEVVPFIRDNCQSPDIAITTTTSTSTIRSTTSRASPTPGTSTSSRRTTSGS